MFQDVILSMKIKLNNILNRDLYVLKQRIVANTRAFYARSFKQADL